MVTVHRHLYINGRTSQLDGSRIDTRTVGSLQGRICRKFLRGTLLALFCFLRGGCSGRATFFLRPAGKHKNKANDQKDGEGEQDHGIHDLTQFKNNDFGLGTHGFLQCCDDYYILLSVARHYDSELFAMKTGSWYD